eukprot:COSAG01_NODE_27161_length_692_cov_8.180438_2_plen_20_part_01
MERATVNRTVASKYHDFVTA